MYFSFSKLIEVFIYMFFVNQLQCLNIASQYLSESILLYIPQFRP